MSETTMLLVTKPKIGLRHHGRKMSLRGFEFAQVEEGYIAELARGYLIVWESASYYHSMQSARIRSYFGRYSCENPEAIYIALNGVDCKLLIPVWDSERHPDLAVYLSKPKGPQNRTLWRSWIPELVIEVVSEGSRDRDYTEKRDEYWTLGIKEYWIVDAHLEQVLALKRGRSQWTEKTLGPKDTCETKLLPGFQLPCQAIFDVAKDDE
jgi:Uma2 family endonuclease